MNLGIENTQGTVGGRVLPLSFFEEARKICDKHEVALHCDGARIWNAAHALGCDVASLTAPRAALIMGRWLGGWLEISGERGRYQPKKKLYRRDVP